MGGRGLRRAAPSARLGAPIPSQAWLRLKDVRVLKPRARGVAQACARGASGGRWPSTSRCARSCPTSRSWASPRSSRDRRELARPAGSRSATARAPGQGDPRGRRRGLRSDVDLPAPDGEELDRSCGRRSRWCPRGSASWRASSASTPRCSPPAPTWSRCCVATPTRGCAGLAGRTARRRHPAPGGGPGRPDLRRPWRAAPDRHRHADLTVVTLAARRLAQLGPQLVERVGDVGDRAP